MKILKNFMQSALATESNFVPQTTYDLRGGLSTYFDIGNSLLSSPVFAPFVLVSAVGLSLAVLAFVLFGGIKYDGGFEPFIYGC